MTIHPQAAVNGLSRLDKLAFARLYHTRAKGQTSQRDAVAQFDRGGFDAYAVFGGNGSGKSRLAVQLAIAAAMGSDDPAVKIWMKNNGVSNRLIPPQGGLVIVSSLTSPLSRLQLRPLVKEYVQGGKWSNENGEGAASYEWDNRRKLIFLANKATYEVYQAYSAVGVVLDEEHSERVFDECIERTMRTKWDGGKGWVLLAMTPLKGITWPHRRFVAPLTAEETFGHYYLDTYDNPYLDIARYKRKDKGKEPDEISRRRRGLFVASDGRIYPNFGDKHLVDISKVPEGGILMAGVDYGVANPFAFVLCAWVQSTRTMYVLDEHYKPGLELSEHEKHIKKLVRKWGPMHAACHGAGCDDCLGTGLDMPNVSRVVYDPSPGVKCGFGWTSKPGKKEVSEGIKVMKELMRIGEEGPRLKVNRRCKHTIDEHTRYHWVPRSASEKQIEMPNKIDDHTCDALRLLCYDVRNW